MNRIHLYQIYIIVSLNRYHTIIGFNVININITNIVFSHDINKQLVICRLDKIKLYHAFEK